MKSSGTSVALASAMLAVAGVLVAPGAAHADMRSPAIGDIHDTSHAGLLSRLGTRSDARAEDFLARHGTAVRDVLADPPSARRVAREWASLDVSARARLEKVAPRLVGSLAGIPLDVRAEVNASRLRRQLDRAERRSSTEASGTATADTTRRVTGLLRLQRALVPAPGGPARSLLTLDTSGDWRTAIAIGDVRHARYVSYLVPGMFFRVQDQVDDWADTAQTLYDDQVAWLNRLGRDASVAIVAWIGYQTPGLRGVGDVALARAGADALQRDLEQLRVVRTGDEPFVSVLAHSYGSTAALIALQRQTVRVDALALLGSPGSDASSVSALDVAAGNVYVAAASYDPVAGSAYFGSDPASPSYGAKPMSVAGGTDPITGAVLAPSYGHNEYFAADSESMRNLALIGIGEGQLVTAAGAAPPVFHSVRAKSLILAPR